MTLSLRFELFRHTQGIFNQLAPNEWHQWSWEKIIIMIIILNWFNTGGLICMTFHNTIVYKLNLTTLTFFAVIYAYVCKISGIPNDLAAHEWVHDKCKFWSKLELNFIGITKIDHFCKFLLIMEFLIGKKVGKLQNLAL